MGKKFLDQSGVSVLWGKILNLISGKANASDLATVATSGAYSDLSGRPTIPTVSNAIITIKQGGTTKGSFGLNQSSATTINLDAGGSGGSVSVVDNNTTLNCYSATEVAIVGGTAIHVTAPAPPLVDGISEQAGSFIVHDVYLIDYNTPWQKQLFGTPDHPIEKLRLQTSPIVKEMLGMRLTLHTAGWNTYAIGNTTYGAFLPEGEESHPIPVMYLGHIGDNLVFNEYMACRWLKAANDALENKETTIRLLDVVRPLTVTFITHEALSAMLLPLQAALAEGQQAAKSIAQSTLKGYLEKMEYTKVDKGQYSVDSVSTTPYNGRWNRESNFLGNLTSGKVSEASIRDLIDETKNSVAPDNISAAGVFLITSLDSIK